MRIHNMVWRWLVALVLLLGGAAWAGEPTTQPLLRLETGMHTAMINRIATDAQGRWAVTASDDKTARIWSVATGQLEGVLRVPQDTGDEGKLHAVAMSPDGAQVAVAGWTKSGSDSGHTIYLLDRTTQRLQRRISGLPNVIHHLAYSSDGRWLAAGLGGQNGVRVFDPGSGQQVGSDDKYKGASYSVEFNPKGNSEGMRLLSTSEDGQIRLHEVSASGQLTLSKLTTPSGGKDPFTARFSPDGQRIAVGFYDTRAVQVLDAQALGLQATLDTGGGTGGDFSKVAWSADGRVLAAAGRAWDADNRQPVRRWSVGDWSRLGDAPVSGDVVMDLVALPKAAGGGWLFASGDPTWGVLDAQAKVLRRRDAGIAIFTNQLQQLRLSEDGTQIRFGYGYGGKDPHRFDVGRRQLTPDAGSPTLQSTKTAAPSLILKDWKDKTTPSLNGQPIKLEQYESSRSLAIAPDGQHFALGADWSLRYFDRTGKERWQQPVPSVVWALNISQDARWVVAGYGDGTIRWHRIEDGREVLAFFPHADRQRWVLWTPEGFYDASPGSEDLIGYHLNRGKDQEGQFVGARQLREAFYQPNLISQRLGPDGDAVMKAAVAKLGDVRERLRPRTTPEITLESPATATTDGAYSPVIKILNAGESKEGEARLVVRLDGVEINARWNGPALSTNQRITLPPLALTPGVRKVSVELVDGRGIASRAVEATVTVRRAAATTAPTLHVLAVGISNYRDNALTRGVAFAANDAVAVAAAFERGAKGLFGQVKSTVLTDQQATRDGILKAGNALSTTTQPDDTVVLYLAGHGVSDNGDYHFVPQDVRYSNFERLKEGSLAAPVLRDLLKNITARKVLVLLDTCSAGGFSPFKGRAIDDKGSLDRLQRLTGRATLAATANEQMALEGEGDARGRHGVFTFALLRGLEGAADRNRDGQVTLAELGEYIDEQVPVITKRRWGYEQFPMMSLDNGSSGLLLARAVR